MSIFLNLSQRLDTFVLYRSFLKYKQQCQPEKYMEATQKFPNAFTYQLEK